MKIIIYKIIIFYKKYIKNPNCTNKEYYTNYRNKLTHIVRKHKMKYYSDLITASQGDSKKLWKVLNNILNRDQNTRVLPETDNAATHLYATMHTHASLADKFNDYFLSIGQNLSVKFPNPRMPLLILTHSP